MGGGDKTKKLYGSDGIAGNEHTMKRKVRKKERMIERKIEKEEKAGKNYLNRCGRNPRAVGDHGSELGDGKVHVYDHNKENNTPDHKGEDG